MTRASLLALALAPLVALADVPDHPVGPAEVPVDYVSPLKAPPPKPDSVNDVEMAAVPPPKEVAPDFEIPAEVDPAGLALPGQDQPAAAQAAEAAPDEPQIEDEIERQSEEMEEMQQAEEKAKLLEPVSPEDAAAREAARLGLGSPLRERLRDAFGREVGPLLVPPPPHVEGSIALLPEIDHDLKKLQAEYDIPIDVNDAVVDYIRFFQSEPARSHFVKWLGRSFRYIPKYRDIMKAHGLPGDTVFLSMIESGFAPYAYSRARASGAWQFIASTGRRMGLKQDFWVDERRDPEKAANAAAKYLKQLYDQTGDWRLAWAGYNAGVGRIFRAQRKGQSDFWTMTRGRVLRKETKGYVPKLMAAAIITKHYELFGFKKEEVDSYKEDWIDYDTVKVPEATDLVALAKAAEVPDQELIDLNPELRRSCTPPRDYELKVPKGHAGLFAKNWPSVPADARFAFVHHAVRRGESMSAIAAAFNVPAATIERFNGLRSGRRLRRGIDLVIPVSLLAKKKGLAPASDQAALVRIAEYQKKNPSSVVRDPPPRAGKAPRFENVAGRVKATVTVQEGDSLWSIGQRFNVGVADICRWNRIRNARRHKLQIGEELIIFPRTTAAAGSGG